MVYTNYLIIYVKFGDGLRFTTSLLTLASFILSLCVHLHLWSWRELKQPAAAAGTIHKAPPLSITPPMPMVPAAQGGASNMGVSWNGGSP